MNELELNGLEGSNPLHALAAFGALVVTSAFEPEVARLGWFERGGRQYARIATSLSPEVWADKALAWTKAAAQISSVTDPAVQQRLKKLKAEEKRQKKHLQGATKQAKKEAKEQGLKGSESKDYVAERVRQQSSDVDEIVRQREATEVDRANELGFGYAHLGDIIGVPVTIFRRHLAGASKTGGRALEAHLASLASDGCLERGGKVQPTPFSFGNGASNQCLLKDWRGLVEDLVEDDLVEGVVGGVRRHRNVTSLNWDPDDLRSAAFQWRDPEHAPKTTDVGANVLAFLGLGILPAIPTQRGISASGFDRGFQWPIWEPLLSRNEVTALLASSLIDREGTSAERRARGILTVWRSEKINPTGKRNYFAPARPLRPHDP